MNSFFLWTGCSYPLLIFLLSDRSYQFIGTLCTLRKLVFFPAVPLSSVLGFYSGVFLLEEIFILNWLKWNNFLYVASECKRKANLFKSRGPVSRRPKASSGAEQAEQWEEGPGLGNPGLRHVPPKALLGQVWGDSLTNTKHYHLQKPCQGFLRGTFVRDKVTGSEEGDGRKVARPTLSPQSQKPPQAVREGLHDRQEASSPKGPEQEAMAWRSPGWAPHPHTQHPGDPGDTARPMGSYRGTSTQ